MGNRAFLRFVCRAPAVLFAAAVLGTGDELEIVARNDFGEGIIATPAVVENTMYLRTSRHLWAIGDATAIGE
jgi:hypothetical protein